MTPDTRAHPDDAGAPGMATPSSAGGHKHAATAAHRALASAPMCAGDDPAILPVEPCLGLNGPGPFRYRQRNRMPIKPENAARYPKDWKAVSLRIRERAGNRCEGSPAYPDCRAKNGMPHPATYSTVVLTVAHLDHQPENCDDENLKAWCQRCHLTYDAKHHAESARQTRRAQMADGDLFAGHT